jgi:hypothetical protein
MMSVVEIVFCSTEELPLNVMLPSPRAIDGKTKRMAQLKFNKRRVIAIRCLHMGSPPVLNVVALDGW